MVSLHLIGDLAVLGSMPWLLRGLWLLGACGACRLCDSAPGHSSCPPVDFFAYQDSAVCVFPNLLKPDALTIVILQFSQKDNTFITRTKVIE